MRPRRTRLVRLGAVHVVGLAALAFATPAHATDDPPPSLPPVAVPELTSEAPVEMEVVLTSAAETESSPVEQESPGNMPPSAPATAQLDAVRQGWSQVISPTHAQKSPERASTGKPQRPASAAPAHEPQYHPRHVQYQRPSTTRGKARAPILPKASFSSGEPTPITRSRSPIASPNVSQNVTQNCALDPESNWSRGLPADDIASLQCATDSPSDQPTSDDPSATSDDLPDSADCADEGTQYQPDEPQYQIPSATTCGETDESAAPISEPEAQVPEMQVPNTSGNVDAPTPPSGGSPATGAAPAPASPRTEPPHSGVNVVPALDGSPPATKKVAPSRPVYRPNHPRLASWGSAAATERAIPVQVRSVSPTHPVRHRPVRSPSMKPRASVSRSKVEAAAPRLLERASSHVNLFDGWLLLVLPLSFVFALALLLPAAAIAGRSLRARVGSKGLADQGAETKSSAGIRYRE